MRSETGDHLVALPKPRTESKLSVEAALKKRRTVRSFLRMPLSLAEVSQLLWAAQGVTDREGNRTAPSPGQTHAIEVYLAAGDVTDLPAGIYRYRPRKHELERLGDRDVRKEIASVTCGQEWVGGAAAIIILAAVPERTRDLFGERGLRFICMEAGHVSENIFLQALAMRLGNAFVGRFEESRVRSITGIPPEEEPLALVPVGKTR